jgi:NCS1 family nucleobase:cation symporter-1
MTMQVEEVLAPIPDDQRVSTASYQFWIWCGANIAPINWILGTLGIAFWGMSMTDTILVLVLGNAVGMGVFGLFVLMGKRTGVSQMVLSRSAFGRTGAYLPAAIQLVVSAGWCAINTFVVLDLVLALLDKAGFTGGTTTKLVVVMFVMAIQAWIAAKGFRIIALFEKYTVPVTLGILFVMTVVAWSQFDIHWDYAGDGLTGWDRLAAGSWLMTAIGIGWGVSWLAYASDYSRFVPRDMPDRKLYTASVLGQFIPVVWLGLLGASLATVSPTSDPGRLIADNYGWLAVPILLLVLHGPIATNIVNLYSCSLAALTLDLKIPRTVMAWSVGVLATVFTLVLVFHTDFGHTLDTWLVGLLMWIAPWGAVLLALYYVVRRRDIDVPALFAPPGTGRLESVRWQAIIAFLVGVFFAWSFEMAEATAFQGWGSKQFHSIDISWLTGFVASFVVYLALNRVMSPREPELLY